MARIPAALCVCLLSLAGEAGAQPSAAPAADLVVEVVGVERLEQSTQLVLKISNPSGESYSNLSDPAYPARDQIRSNDLSGIRLLDEASDTEYLPLRNLDERVCVCTRLWSDQLEDGRTVTAWWRSQPLPAAVDRVTVLGPDGSAIATGVEVTG